MRELTICEVNPQGEDALALLRLAAAEARALYPELHNPNAPEPTNDPTPPLGIYLIAYLEGQPVAMGAHRPLDRKTTEIRRMYVRQEARRLGAARRILAALEAHAGQVGFAFMRLETGFRQLPARRLYEDYGFRRIEPFGRYASDPTSVCYERAIACATSDA